MKNVVISLTIIGFIFARTSGFCQPKPAHFTFSEKTGNNAIVIIQTTINPGFSDGQPLSAGDEIGIFTPDSLCCGAVVWDNQNTALTAWADDPQSPGTIDGFRAGEQLMFRLWQNNTDIDCAAEVSFIDGPTKNYQDGGFFVLASLSGQLPERLRGDVNTDGTLNNQDVTLIVGFILNKTSPTDAQKWAADCNSDDTINVLDIALLLKWILGG